jgi:hypothetical protein
MIHWIHYETKEFAALTMRARLFLDSDAGESLIEPYFLKKSVTAAEIDQQAQRWLRPVPRERKERKQ